jgi:hypothetical protein
LRLLEKYPELEVLHLDFSQDFETSLAAMLAGSAMLFQEQALPLRTPDELTTAAAHTR